jgi:tRNA A37 threonylcarbamoyltransferase TsaD
MQQINQMYKEVRQEIQAAEQKGYMPSLEFKQHVERTQQGLAQSLESQQRMEQEQRARLAIAQDERPGMKTSSSPRLG